jgi:hypothetical protein
MFLGSWNTYPCRTCKYDTSYLHHSNTYAPCIYYISGIIMPRPTKKRASALKASSNAVLKRRKLVASSRELDASTSTPLSPPSALVELHAESSVDALTANNANMESCELESDVSNDGFLNQEEDKYPIEQPENGWGETERRAHGYSKLRVYKQKVSYHKNKKEVKRKREEKKALDAGLPITQRPKPKWGNISNFFNPASSASTAPSPPRTKAYSYTPRVQRSGKELESETEFQSDVCDAILTSTHHQEIIYTEIPPLWASNIVVEKTSSRYDVSL